MVDVISEEGTYYPDEIIPCHYSYHVPKIQSDASGAVRINEEIMRRYAELVQDALDTDEVPECDGISYKHYQNGNVLSLVVTYSFGMGGLMDYSVFHYDVERDKALDQDDLPGLLGVSEETLQNAIVRAAAQKFDEAYHDLEQWEDDPSEFYRYRAETLGDYYLDNALVSLGEGGAAPRAPALLDLRGGGGGVLRPAPGALPRRGGPGVCGLCPRGNVF